SVRATWPASEPPAARSRGRKRIASRPCTTSSTKNSMRPVAAHRCVSGSRKAAAAASQASTTRSRPRASIATQSRGGARRVRARPGAELRCARPRAPRARAGVPREGRGTAVVGAEAVFFVTGAARGIGAAFARLAVGRGRRVVLADVDETGAKTLAAELGERACAVALDVRDAAAWEEALDAAWARFGRVDVLVNNAGLLHPGTLLDHSDAELRQMLDVNVLGVI